MDSLEYGAFTEAMPSYIPDIIDRHVGDAAFYWQQHDRSAHSPLLTLDDLKQFDRLLDAHLEGASVAGEWGWHTALQALKRWGGAEELFVCAYLAMTGEARWAGARWQEISAVLLTDPHRMLRGLISALLWVPVERAVPWVDVLGQTEQPVEWQVAAWRAVARSKLLLECSAVAVNEWRMRLNNAIHGRNPYLRSAACRAAPQLGDLAVLPLKLDDADVVVRAEAAIALLQANATGLERSLHVLWKSVWQRAEELPSLTGVYYGAASHQLARWVRHLAMSVPVGHPDVSKLVQLLPVRLALPFVLHHGDPAYIPWVHAQLEKRDCARLAGWVWSSMTGLDLEDNGLVYEVEPEQELDDDVASTDELDLGLPLPCAALISTHHSVPLNDRSFVGGRMVDKQVLLEILLHAPQELRWITSHKARSLNPGGMVVDTRAAYFQQRAQLALMEAVSNA